MSKKTTLMKNTVIIFCGKVCTQLISFFLLPLYTGYLSTNDYGIVDLITTYITLLVPIITLELEMSIFRYLVDSRGNNRETKKLMSNNFFILLVALSSFLVIYCIALLFFDFDFKWLILVDIIICTLSGNFLQVARGMGKTLDYSISCLITGAFTIVSNIFLIAVLGLGARGMIISMMLANGLGALYLFVRLKLYKLVDFKLVDKSLIKEMYRYSIPLVPNGISWWIVNVSDRSIISWVLGTASNGLYAVSNKFPTILSSLLGIFNLSWSESAALHINSPDRDEFFSDICNTVVKLFTSLGVGMIACLPFVFPLLINKQYNDAYYQIPILILGAIFNVVICLYSAIYIAKKMTKQVAYVSIIGAVINILINLLFIKHIGLYAASISTAISYFVMMIYRHIDLKKYVNIKYEKGLVLKTILIYTLAIILYYKNNLLLNIISLIVVVIYAIIINKDFLNSLKNVFLKKILKR
ncbi:MAG: oligosaccharide flippase family protein [bacterium]|nr:oligosaccharide flippase family protein [bacterium]